VLVGLVLGLPLGVLAARNAWATVTGNLGVATEHLLPPVPGIWLVAVPAAAGLLGAVMARHAIRARPAAALRAAHRE
jgi:hypothetical protein